MFPNEHGWTGSEKEERELNIAGIPRCTDCGYAMPGADATAFRLETCECPVAADREPPDQGEDDGPLTFSQRAEVEGRDMWRVR